MPFSVIVHISGEEPIVGEIEEMPLPSDNVFVLKNPRKKDGKDIPFLARDVNIVLWPWGKINFLEILPSETDDEIIGFVRE